MSAGATRAQIVAGQIRQAIQAGVYVSGERLVELTLAARLKVSQNTVRDALRLLEAEGWVVKRARHGVTVRSFTAEDVQELYALWEALEPLVLRWTLSTAARKQLGVLRRMIQTAQRDLLAGSSEDSVDTLYRFHAAARDLCGRPAAISLLSTVHNRLFLLENLRQMRQPRDVSLLEERLAQYGKLVDAMEVNRADEAEGLLRRIIRAEAEQALLALDSVG